MGRLDLRISLAGLVAVMVILAISIPFSMGLIATMQKQSPRGTDQADISKGTDWQQNSTSVIDQSTTASGGVSDFLASAAIVAILIIASVVAIELVIIRKAQR